MGGAVMMAMTVSETQLESAPRSVRTPPRLRAADWPRDALDERLLHVDPRRRTFVDARVRDLPSLLHRGDLVVVNDAATFPGSLRGRTERGASIEVRLLRAFDDGSWLAFLLGEGDHRTQTEHRPLPPFVRPFDVLDFTAMRAEIIEARSTREIVVRFDREGDRFWSALYAVGRPVQYAHVPRALPLWAVQTSYASRPWAAEMPSAGRPLRWGLLSAMIDRGVVVRALTHAAGLSSIGDAAIDASLPRAERFEIPRETALAIAEARARGGRIVAVGTSVVRAIEGCASQHDGVVTSGRGETDLLLSAETRPRVVSGLFTGMHEDETTSHHALLRAFADDDLLDRAFTHASRVGYLAHEFGDSTLFLADRAKNELSSRSE